MKASAVEQVIAGLKAAILDIEASTNQNVAGVIPNPSVVIAEYVWRWALAQYEVTRAVGRGGKRELRSWICLDPEPGHAPDAGWSTGPATNYDRQLFGEPRRVVSY